MSLNISQPGFTPKTSKPLAAPSSDAKKEALTVAGVSELLSTENDRAKKQTSSQVKSSASSAKSAVKQALAKNSTQSNAAQQQGSTQGSDPTTTSTNSNTNSKSIPNSGADGVGSRFSDAEKNGFKEADKSKADTQSMIDKAQPKDNSETGAGSGSGGSGGSAPSLNNTMPGLPPGTNINYGNQNFGVVQNSNPTPPATQGWEGHENVSPPPSSLNVEETLIEPSLTSLSLLKSPDMNE